MNLLGTILTSGAVGVVLVAFVGLVGTLRGLKANQPVVAATAEEKQAAANASSFTAQQSVITTLEGQLQRQERRAEEMQVRVDAVEVRLAEAEHKNDLLAAEAERSDEQVRMQKQYLKACRDRNQMLSNWIENHYATEHPDGGSPPQHLLRF